MNGERFVIGARLSPTFKKSFWTKMVNRHDIEML